ncbi:uncharacterized protein PFLUO_LOCUS3901 [Penicillium psychrofluorescens]|uniref:uncharacterized protein n=1 Tax=Penicillium psychrofluorescens TaxID=3158075 RepID=UPI003CCCE917
MPRPLGTPVCIGIPNTPFKLPATPFEMIVKGKQVLIYDLKIKAAGWLLNVVIGLTIVGNSGGTAKEMDELLEMSVAGDVKMYIVEVRIPIR